MFEFVGFVLFAVYLVDDHITEIIDIFWRDLICGSAFVLIGAGLMAGYLSNEPFNFRGLIVSREKDDEKSAAAMCFGLMAFMLGVAFLYERIYG